MNMSTGQQLEILFEHCTDGIGIVEGDDNFFNMHRIMNVLKVQALPIFEKPIDIDSIHLLTSMIRTALTNIQRTVSHASIPENDERLVLAKNHIRNLVIELRKQRNLLTERKDVISGDVAPATQLDESPPQNERLRENENFVSEQRIRQLLWRMQELNS